MELDKKLIVDVARLAEEGETLEGEVDIVDLDEEFVKPFGGVRYRLKAQLFGHELLVKGTLEQDFDLVCSMLRLVYAAKNVIAVASMFM